jgi:hypothetical protein
MFCVQSFFCFIFIYIEALITTKTAYIIYFVAVGGFGVFTWMLFYTAFDLKDKKKIE